LDEHKKDNTRRLLYGLSMNIQLVRTKTLEESAEKTAAFLNDIIKLYPTWSPFYITSSDRCGLIAQKTIPSLEEMKEHIIDALQNPPWRTMTFCNIGRNHDNIGKMLEIRMQSGHCYKNCSCVRFPPRYKETKYISSKEFIKEVFDLFLKHWQPSNGYVIPSIPIIRRFSNELFDDIGWLTYFSDKLGELPPLPDWAKIIPVDGYGNYVQVSDNLPDPANEDVFRDVIEKMCELSKIIEPWLITKSAINI
jgi:hypothetical protein